MSDDRTTDRRVHNAAAQRRRRERQHEAGRVQFRAWVTADEAVKLKSALTQWRPAADAETIRVRRLRKLEELQRRARKKNDASLVVDHEDGDAPPAAESSDQHARQRKLRALLACRHIK